MDKYEVTKDPNIPWKISDVDLINTTGAELLRRATIEFQRRFMGNKREFLFGDYDPAIDIMDRTLMATVLDLCNAHMTHLTIQQSTRSLGVLKANCVEFYLY